MMEIQNFWVKMRECFCPRLAETPVQYNKVTSSLDFAKKHPYPSHYMEKKITLCLS